MKKLIPVIYFFSCLIAAHSFGGSATWSSNPPSGDWNTAADWAPETVPNGVSDIATFEVTNQSAVDISAETIIGSIVFAPEASAYIVTVREGATLTVEGAGIDNQSGVTQIIVAKPGPFGTAPGFLNFANSSSAGTATIINPGGGNAFAIGGDTFFSDMSTADHAVLITMGAQGSGSSSGLLLFKDYSTGGSSVIISGGGAESDAGSGAMVAFSQQSSAGKATITSQGGKVPGAFGGQVQFTGFATAAEATITANGRFGASGSIGFYQSSNGGVARIKLIDEGYMVIDSHNPPGVTVGSIEGSGSIFPGANILTVGTNNLNTTFAGVIDDAGAGGGLAKTGSGSLTLRGNSSYSGGTTVRSGYLFVDSLQGSGTGDGPVIVTRGTLGGVGTIGGQVIVGMTGESGSPKLSPGSARQAIGNLLILGSLSFSAGSSMVVQLDPESGTSDEVTANGVIIGTGPQVDLHARPGLFAIGTAFVLINNTSGDPISGTFGNLVDGSTVRVGDNNFQANYEGGDGNDLTLTVVQ